MGRAQGRGWFCGEGGREPIFLLCFGVEIPSKIRDAVLTITLSEGQLLAIMNVPSESK